MSGWFSVVLVRGVRLLAAYHPLEIRHRGSDVAKDTNPSRNRADRTVDRRAIWIARPFVTADSKCSTQSTSSEIHNFALASPYRWVELGRRIVSTWWRTFCKARIKYQMNEVAVGKAREQKESHFLQCSMQLNPSEMGKNYIISLECRVLQNEITHS